MRCPRVCNGQLEIKSITNELMSGTFAICNKCSYIFNPDFLPKKSQRTDKVTMYEFDGTLAGFHLMMERLYGDINWGFVVDWVDENGNSCWLFHGIVLFIKSGLTMREGDVYYVPVKE